MGGLEALRCVRESGASAEVVVLTGHPDVTTAIEAMKLGAYDYLTKPFKLAEVEIVLRRAGSADGSPKKTRRCVGWWRNGASHPRLGSEWGHGRVLATVERIAAADANVLIEGRAAPVRAHRADHPPAEPEVPGTVPGHQLQRIPGSTPGE